MIPRRLCSASTTLPSVDGFAAFLRAQARSPCTVRAYTGAVHRILAAIGHEPDQAALLRYLSDRRHSAAVETVNMDVKALRAWHGYRLALDPRFRTELATDGLQKHPAQRLVRALDDHQVGQLLAAPDLGTYVGFRDHVLMATIYQCGLRASEVVGLQLGSILDAGVLRVLGKGRKERLVPFGERWLWLIEAYLRVRRQVRPGKLQALFLTRRGTAFASGRAVWAIVNRYARRTLGLACGYECLQRGVRRQPWQGHYPHLLRAAFATELHRRGVNLIALRDMLGHADVATTARYIGIDLEQLRAAIACHPRATHRTPP